MRIIFLDIDGPMIPSYMYILHESPSWNRVFSPICVGLVNALCQETGAKIVTNTTHNSGWIANPLKGDLITGGVSEKHFHEAWRTIYPAPQTTRRDAILQWEERHGPSDFVVFDDATPQLDERWPLLDFDTGITLVHYNFALQQWGLKPKIIL